MWFIFPLLKTPLKFNILKFNIPFYMEGTHKAIIELDLYGSLRDDGLMVGVNDRKLFWLQGLKLKTWQSILS